MLKKDKDKRYGLLLRIAAVAFFSICLVAMTYQGVIYSMSKQVTILDNSKEIIVAAEGSITVEEALALADISLTVGDKVNPPLQQQLADGESIVINRALHVVINNGKDTIFSVTEPVNIAELLKANGIDAAEGVKVDASLSSVVSDGQTVNVTYTRTEELTVTDIIPYEQQYVDTNELEIGETRIKQQGENGRLATVYKLYYENGDLVSKTLDTEYVEVEPVAMIIENGIKAKPTPTPQPTAKPKTNISAPSAPQLMSRGGSDFTYRSKIEVTAYAYCLDPSSTGKSPGDRGYGVTASGYKAERGVIAVDPSVIPLGTKIYVEAADGSWVYGHAVAADTGAGIHGNKIDLFMDSKKEATNFGVKKAVVYILD